MPKIMKDGKPSTSFSRQDREWVKKMRGTTPSGTITITENGEYDVTEYATADVNVAGAASDFSTAEVTVTVGALENRADFYGSCIVEDALSTIASFQPSSSGTLIAVLYKEEGQEFELDAGATSITTTGDVTENDGIVTVTGNGTITLA